jgi:amino acid adenylation domain-containing protein
LSLSRLPLLTDSRRATTPTLGHGPVSELPSPAVLPDLLLAQARRTPDAPAVVCGSETLSYAELHARARRLAAVLRRLGVGPEVPVAICAERSLELVVALLAVFNAGGVLVPLDPEHPRDRLLFQITDARAAVLLTQRDLSPTLGDPGCPVVLLDEPATEFSRADPGPADRLHPDNAACLLFTSGSTGWPKGVVTSHRALVNHLEWTQRRFGLTADDIVLHKTSLSFDVSLWELLWPLVSGAQLVLAHPNGHRDPGYLCDEITRQKVTTVHFVPSMLDAFLDASGIEQCRSLRRVISSGEDLTRTTVDRCHEQLPHAELHNLYGPTEAAIDVSAWLCRPGESGRVPIGHPAPNTQLYVLDRWLEPVPVGFPGDLYIAGVQLARGYLGEPARTAEVFLPNPYGPAGSRLYRTGDRARVRPDGAIEFLGRADTQVKVHGVRVELGELESILVEHPKVRQVAATVRGDTPGSRELVVYVCWDGDPGEVTPTLREVLARRVPESTMPKAFVTTAEFPTLPSGKVDRSALPAGEDGPVVTPYQQPDTPGEQELCDLWSELLGRDKIGATDDFFQLGGHSLLAVALVDQVRERFGIELPLRRCFEITTISEHAQEILGLSLAGQDAARISRDIAVPGADL